MPPCFVSGIFLFLSNLIIIFFHLFIPRHIPHWSYYCFFTSPQNFNLILSQTPCLAPILQCLSNTTLIYPSCGLWRKFSSTKQLPTFSIIYPPNSRFCCHLCFTSTSGIQPVFQITKLFTNSTSSKNDISLLGSTISFIVSALCSQTKLFAKVEVTLFIFTHLPCTHLPHLVHITKFSLSLWLHLAHGSTLLWSISPCQTLTITLIFLRFTFNPLLWNVSFYLKNFLSNSLQTTFTH